MWHAVAYLWWRLDKLEIAEQDRPDADKEPLELGSARLCWKRQYWPLRLTVGEHTPRTHAWTLYAEGYRRQVWVC